MIFTYFAIQSTLPMKKEQYLEDITEIKSILNRSSRFISLSGFSGVLAGVYSLIGAWVAYSLIQHQYTMVAPLTRNNTSSLENSLLIVGVLVALLSMATGIALTVRKANRNSDKIWDSSTKRLLINFGIPLITGGLFILVLLDAGMIGMIAPCTLIFYGLSCVNASKYTIGTIRYLGIAEIILGLVATQYIGYGLHFWALGFGVFHIIYGTFMHFKYDQTIS